MSDAEEVPVPAVAEDGVPVPMQAPAPPREGWLEIARAQSYITGEPSFLRRFYQYWENVDRKELVDLYDHRTNSEARDQMFAHYCGLLYDIGGLLLARHATIQKELDDFVVVVEGEDPYFQVFHLRLKLASLIDELSFGLPPKTPEGEWDLTEEEVFEEIAPRIIALHETKEVERTVKK